MHPDFYLDPIAFNVRVGKSVGRLKPERTVLEVKLCRVKGKVVMRIRWWANNFWRRRTINNMKAYHDLLHEILGDHWISLKYSGPIAGTSLMSRRDQRVEEKMALIESGQLGARSVAEA